MRGDLSVEISTGSKLILDFSVTDPSAEMFLKIPHCSHLFVDKANIFQENSKISNYNEVTPSIINNLLIFSLEATGRVGPKASKFLCSILPTPKSGIIPYKQMLKQFECIIVKQNAMMYNNIIDIKSNNNNTILNLTNPPIN